MWPFNLTSLELLSMPSSQHKSKHMRFKVCSNSATLLTRMASTAVTAWLLGHPKPAALSAFSHAWIDGHALRAFRQSPNAGPRKGWAAGDACMRAVHLALIAQRGIHTDPTTSS